MFYRNPQAQPLFLVACLLTVESGQLRDQVRHDAFNGYFVEFVEKVDGSIQGEFFP